MCRKGGGVSFQRLVGEGVEVDERDSRVVCVDVRKWVHSCMGSW